MVSRSLAARIESMIVVNDASTSGGTISDWYQLIVICALTGRWRTGRGVCNVQDMLKDDMIRKMKQVYFRSY